MMPSAIFEVSIGTIKFDEKKKQGKVVLFDGAFRIVGLAGRIGLLSTTKVTLSL